MKRIAVIYHHADFDGIFSRETAKFWLGTGDANREISYIGWDYSEPKPKVDDCDIVYMIDISVDGLMDHPGLIWIDHHKSAIEKYGTKIAGYRIDGVAACRLAWQWFSRSEDTDPLPSKEDYVERLVMEPLAITLAGEYDIWNKTDPRTDLFQFGLGSLEVDFVRVFNKVHYVTEIIERGRIIKEMRERENASIITKQGFTMDFEGLKFICVNAARYNSMLFTAAVRPEHDGCLGFNWDGKKWKVSLYGVPGKPDVDLSLIAVKHGGGGHKQACGFSCAALPFQLSENQRKLVSDLESLMHDLKTIRSEVKRLSHGWRSDQRLFRGALQLLKESGNPPDAQALNDAAERCDQEPAEPSHEKE